MTETRNDPRIGRHDVPSIWKQEEDLTHRGKRGGRTKRYVATIGGNEIVVRPADGGRWAIDRNGVTVAHRMNVADAKAFAVTFAAIDPNEMATRPTAGKMEIDGEEKWLRADRLVIDPIYQRPKVRETIRKVSEEFDARAFGALYVSERADGSQVVIDGQQRLTAVVEAMQWGDQLVPCLVYYGLTVEEEADLFVKYNGPRTKPRPLDMYRADLARKDPTAIAIESIISKRNLRLIAGSTSSGSIQSIAAVRNVYDRAGADVLGRTLDVIVGAWGASADGLVGEYINTVGVILSRGGRKVQQGRLSQALAKHDPKQLVRRARIIHAELGVGNRASGRMSSVLAQLILKEYNNRLSVANRVEWEEGRSTREFWK